MSQRLPLVHPGEILREEFLDPLQWSANRLASELKVSTQRINELLHERRAITADTALRLSRFFGTTPEFWMNLQTFYDLRKAANANGRSIRREIRGPSRWRRRGKQSGSIRGRRAQSAPAPAAVS